MKLTQNSKNHFYNNIDGYDVPREYSDAIYHYLVYGLEPGGFFTALLANDFVGAMGRSHPNNSIQGLKNLVTWMVNELPRGVAWGSYEVVNGWLATSPEDRRKILEIRRLVYTEQDEIIMILKGEKV